MNFIGALEFSKVVIVFFVMTYAYYFLYRSEAYEERRPWVALFMAAIFLFILQLIKSLQVIKGAMYETPLLNAVVGFTEFCFLGLFLFSFIYQHKLLIQRRVIMISDVPRTTLYDRLDQHLHRLAKRYQTILGHEDPIDLALDKIEDEQEELATIVRYSPEEEKRRYQLRQRAQKLVGLTEDLLKQYEGKTDRVKIVLIKDELEELKVTFNQKKLKPGKIEKLLKKLLTDDASLGKK